jgi:hypothetical protein
MAPTLIIVLSLYPPQLVLLLGPVSVTNPLSLSTFAKLDWDVTLISFSVIDRIFSDDSPACFCFLLERFRIYEGIINLLSAGLS